MSESTRPPTWKVWVLATRPNTLAASLSPVVVGSAVAARDGLAKDLAAPVMLFWVFAAMIQIGTNLYNDYSDFVKGADTKDRVGQARATQKGWLTPTQVANAASGVLLFAFCLGIVVFCAAFRGGWPATFVTLTSVFNAFAYTGGEWPLGLIGLGWVSIGYAGLGDVFAFAYFGVVATVFPYYLALCRAAPAMLPSSSVSLQDAFITWPESFSYAALRSPLAASLPVGCLVTAIIVVNNLRDRHTDILAAKRTLAVRFGGGFARFEYALLVVSAYLLTLVGAADVGPADAPWRWGPRLVPLASLPIAVKQLRAVCIEKDGAALNPHVGGTAKLQLAFCMLLAIGIHSGL